MAASQDNFILEIFLNGCFSKTAANTFYISYCDVMLKRNEFLCFFLDKDFRERCKHTELALYFIQQQYFGSKNPFSFHYSRIATARITELA